MDRWSRRDNQLLLCPVHVGAFVDPKLLRCNHAACLECLEGVAEGKLAVVCPICRRETPLPWEGAIGLPDALNVMRRSTSVSSGHSHPLIPKHYGPSNTLPSVSACSNNRPPASPSPTVSSTNRAVSRSSTLPASLRLSEPQSLPHRHQETWYIECTRYEYMCSRCRQNNYYDCGVCLYNTTIAAAAYT